MHPSNDRYYGISHEQCSLLAQNLRGDPTATDCTCCVTWGAQYYYLLTMDTTDTGYDYTDDPDEDVAEVIDEAGLIVEFESEEEEDGDIDN